MSELNAMALEGRLLPGGAGGNQRIPEVAEDLFRPKNVTNQNFILLLNDKYRCIVYNYYVEQAPHTKCARNKHTFLYHVIFCSLLVWY